ncbi:unnamed protein product [Cunninghamella echinulata]
MGVTGGMTPKALANKMKAKGLLKLKFYCQVCQKQCRDENGFKCHTQSEFHQRQMLLVADNPGKYVVNYSDEFQKDFIKVLSRRHGTKRVFANAVYQEYIANRHHIHMNSTKWNSLSEFVRQLGREGICHVDETERGFWITWIDNSPKALARQAAIQKMDRHTKDDEEREQELLKEQIERASKLAEEKGLDKERVATELKRSESQNKIKLNLSLNTSSSEQKESSSTTDTAAIPATKKSTGNKMKLLMGGMKKQESTSSLSTTSTNDKKPSIMFGLGKRKATDVPKTSSDTKKIKSSS